MLVKLYFNMEGCLNMCADCWAWDRRIETLDGVLLVVSFTTGGVVIEPYGT